MGNSPDREPRRHLENHRLLRAAKELTPSQRQLRHVILPMSAAVQLDTGSELIARIRSRPQLLEKLVARRLLVADPLSWRVHSLRTGPRIGGSVIHADCPALTRPGFESAEKLPPVPIDFPHGVELDVEYVGGAARSSKETFLACFYADVAVDLEPGSGSVERERNSSGTPTGATSVVAQSGLVRKGESVCVPLPPRSSDFFASGISLLVDHPSDWIIEDVVVGGDTLLVDSGGLPGDLFARWSRRSPDLEFRLPQLSLGRVRAGDSFFVSATHQGASPAIFEYEVSGHEVPAGNTAGDYAFLPVDSGTKILTGTTSVVCGRADLPDGYCFIPEGAVLQDPESWVILDVKVGNRTQFAQGGDVPGVAFGACTVGCPMTIEPIYPGMGLSVVARYMGSDRDGGRFVFGVVGRVARVPVHTPAGPLDQVKP